MGVLSIKPSKPYIEEGEWHERKECGRMVVMETSLT